MNRAATTGRLRSGAIYRATTNQDLTLQKRQQVFIQLILMGHGEAMRTIFIHLQFRTGDHLRRHFTGGGKRHNLIVAAVDHQRRDIPQSLK